MTKTERIAELERRVAALEAKPYWVHAPYSSGTATATIPPTTWVTTTTPCSTCGRSGIHVCGNIC